MRTTSFISVFALALLLFTAVSCDDDDGNNSTNNNNINNSNNTNVNNNNVNNSNNTNVNNNNNNNTNQVECGDDVMNGTELCDGADLDGNDCESIGMNFVGGTLACNSTCDGWDTSACEEEQEVCGDGVASGTESCDTDDLAGNDCTTLGLGLTGGTLACDDTCNWDISGCTGIPVCGDSMITGTEVCDTDELDGQDCTDGIAPDGRPYAGGTLACGSNCLVFDYSGCTEAAPACGDGFFSTGETCDGTYLNGQTCADQGHFNAGTLACNSTCDGFDTSACVMNPVCGDGTIDGTEVCDGANLGGESCGTQGQDAGTLLCNSTCDGFDTTGCCTNNCVLGSNVCADATTLTSCELVGACADIVDVECPTACADIPPAQCAGGVNTTCDDVYDLNGETFPTTIIGTFDGGPFINPASCSGSGQNAFYASYTLQNSDYFSMEVTTNDTAGSWLRLAAFTISSGDMCDASPIRQELLCENPTGDTISFEGVPGDLGLSAGDTVYFLMHGDGASYYLEDIDINIVDIDCSTHTPSVTSLPADGAVDVNPYNPIEIQFAEDVTPDFGTITISENGVPVANYDLATSPADVTVSGGTVTIDSTWVAAFGSNVTVDYSLEVGYCAVTATGSIAYGILASAIGETCGDSIGLVDGTNLIDGANVFGMTLDVLNDSFIDISSCCSLCDQEDTTDSLFYFTATSSTVEITMDKTTNNRIVMVVLDDCSTPMNTFGCGSEYTNPEVTVVATGLTVGNVYTLAVRGAYDTSIWPDTSTSMININPIICGDGDKYSAEGCDDGNTAAGDGCSPTCQIEPGWDCDGASPSTCSTTTCGDGTIEGVENCEDGNNVAGDGCDEYCQVEDGWLCDSATPNVCHEVICGDGVIEADEVCDDGNALAGDGCDDLCQVEDGWLCDSAEPTVCHEVICGDGVIEADEVCDDGNAAAGDGCDDLCQVEDGWLCDGAEPTVCHAIVCGDGLIEGTEVCDDGNTTAGDGCDDLCAIETDYSCTGEPSVCSLNYTLDTSFAYSWVDLTSDASATSIVLGDDDNQSVSMGMSFPFYGNSYTDVYIVSNGFLTFGTSSTSLTNQCPMSSSTPNDVIALHWDDLDPGDNSDPVYYRHFTTCPVGSGECFVVQYEGYSHYNSSGAVDGSAGTFQAVLFDNGSVLIQIQDPGAEAGDSATVGIENSDSSMSLLAVSCNTAGSLTATSAYCFVAPGSTGCN